MDIAVDNFVDYFAAPVDRQRLGEVEPGGNRSAYPGGSTVRCDVSRETGFTDWSLCRESRVDPLKSTRTG